MHEILVGVTGKGENTDALVIAARYARATGQRVTLVHAVPPSLPPAPPSALLADNSWEAVARTILADVDDEFRTFADEVPVDVVAAHGHPGSVFHDLSRSASLVVLEHRDMSRLHRIATGSTVASVAARARCPVVSVPAASSEGPSAGVVTAGVHEDGGPRPVLEAAFAQAALLGCSVRLVHGWRLAATYDDMLLHDARWRNEAHAAITSAAEEVGRLQSEVEVAVEVRHDWPADVLVASSGESDLLVVGRHDRHGLVPERLGSLTRSMLEHAHCPVMVVPLR